MLSIGIMPPSAVYESCIEFTAPVEVSVVDAGEQRRAEDAEALLLALHRAAGELGRGAARRASSSQRDQRRARRTNSVAMAARIA